ncbi:MAG: polyphosphate kinase 2 family protein [Pirellulales bacterium]
MSTHRIDHTPFLVEPGKKLSLKDHDPRFTSDFKNKKQAHAALLEDVSLLADAQELLWASKEYSVIVIFQAMDAAGKDGTIKHVMSGVNPQGVAVHSFKAPSDEERLHHFLWRPMRIAPARGQIAIFNRSYYEEVLVVRVHPEFLDQQWLSRKQRSAPLKDVWQARFEDINAFERTNSHNNVCIIKFFLNVSREEQRERFLERLENPEKHWKFSAADLRERAYWDEYQHAYEEMLQATSTKDAPWYVIPADKKWFARACVADIIAYRIRHLDLRYPTVSAEAKGDLDKALQQLKAEDEKPSPGK